MSIQPVVFPTDILLGILLLGGLLLVWLSRRQGYFLEPWLRVGQSATGMATATVLLLYLTVGVLDSLHYRPALPGDKATATVEYSPEVLSVLDTLLAPLKNSTEKTYSAPLAVHLYGKETLTQADGRQVRDYPPVLYGGAERPPVGSLLLRGLLLALPFWLVLWGLWRLARRRNSPLRWDAAVLTAGGLAWVGLSVAELAAYYHVLGTDKVGQDVLYQSLKSVRTGLLIGTLTTLVMLPFSLLMGAFAGYFKGWVDDLIQYIYTTLSSIPGVLLIAASVLIMQSWMDQHPDWFATVAERADARLLALCFILGLTSWTSLARLIRGETMKLVELDYVAAATAFGVSHRRIILRHILPNLMHIVMISVVMDFSGLVLAEAVLSYVGVGVDPTMASWGNMINGARLEMAREPVVWWQLAAAFVFMFVLVLAANLFSDTVQTAFDPRTRQREAA